ncbi:MAG: hypothetical protein QG673_1125 [Pseudomonadota bacterium]|nr:hypothetical protein [Pseudomonadota bacterium]
MLCGFLNQLNTVKKEWNYIMNEPILLDLIHSFDEFLTRYANDEYISAFNTQIYFNLCDIINAMGYSTMAYEYFDELFKLHMEYEQNGATMQDRMLSFIIQLTHLPMNKETLSKYATKCCDPRQIYDLLYQNKQVSFKHPQCINSVTFIYQKSDILPVFLKNNILVEI